MSHPGLIALFSGLVAQASKVLVALLTHRQWRPGLLFANGGMPSSHTATVTTLTLAVGSLEGYGSSIFSLVLIFSFYVIFEATGLRQEIGHQAQLLNDLMDEALAGQAVDRRRLRELVGHTWSEVAGGMVMGVLVFLVWSRYLAG
jgi:acid phosphatase family membrane protein YuiD